MPVVICRRCKKVTHLFGDMAGKFGQGTVASLAAAYFMENSPERRQSSNPYCLNPPDSQSVFFLPVCPHQCICTYTANSFILRHQHCVDLPEAGHSSVHMTTA